MKELDETLDYLLSRIEEKYKNLTKAFRAIDIHNKGVITLNQFILAFDNLHIHTNYSVIKAIFSLLHPVIEIEIKYDNH
jgi:Ca2+-binding EF-hand superfamily protein